MYSYDFKKRAVEYRLENHTTKETAEVFKIGTTTVNKWVKELKVTGELTAKYDSSNRTFKKINPKEFTEYLKNNNDLFRVIS